MGMSNCEWAQLMEDCGGYEGPEEHLEQWSIREYEDEDCDQDSSEVTETTSSLEPTKSEQEIVNDIGEHVKYLEEHNYFEERNEHAMRLMLGNDGIPAIGKIVLYDKMDTQELIDLLLMGKYEINITNDGIGISRQITYGKRTRLYAPDKNKKSETFETIQLDIQCPFLEKCKLKHGECIDKYNGYVNSYKDLRDNSLYNGAGNKIIVPKRYFTAIKNEWVSCEHYKKDKIVKNPLSSAYLNEIDRLIAKY